MLRLVGLFIPGGNVIAILGGAAGGFLRFATSTVGMVLLAAVCAYGTGWHMSSKRCDAANLRARLAAMQADLKSSRDAESLAQKQADDLEEANRANEEKVNALASDLKKRPGRSACGLSHGESLGLRRIK